MDESKELPGKKAPKIEDPKTKKSSPSAPVVETPVPPQVMDPSTHPYSERAEPSTTRNKRKRIQRTSR